jgi:hypothetical protein
LLPAMGGKGKGKGPAPPPSGEGAAKAHAELQQKKREQMERQKREAQENIAQAKALEAKKRDLEARLPTLQSHDIAQVPWDTVLLSTHLCGGKGAAGVMHTGSAGGVEVVELPGSTAVCVRHGSCIITESIADALAEVLSVRVARMRLVLADSDECHLIKHAVERFSTLDIAKDMERLEKLIPTMDEESAAKVRAMINAGPSTCAVLEFVPGHALDISMTALEAPTPGLLTGLGQLCALDLLLNNMDRVPLPCWENAGNLTNAIVTLDGELVGIDQQVNHIEPGPGLDAYLGKIRDLSAQILQGSAPGIATSIRIAIKKHCSVELSDGSMEHVIEGMGAVLRKTISEARAGSLAVVLAAAAVRAGKATFNDYGQTSQIDPADIAAVAVAFLQQVVDAVMGAAVDQ